MNLKGQNIVFFSLFRFDADIESSAYTIASLLAADNQVFYVDNPVTLRDWWQGRRSDFIQKRRRFFSWFSKEEIATPVPGLKVIIPPVVLSIHFLQEGWLYRKLLAFNEWMIRRRIRRVLYSRGITDFIYINGFNFHYPGVQKGLSHQLSVYYCLDPVAGDFDGRHGLISEPILIRNSDLVICSSKRLYQDKRLLNKQTFLVPNAADVEHSSKALLLELPVSAKVAHVSRPVIGYFGSIEHRFDFDLMYRVAILNPGYSFVLAGPVFTHDVQGLDQLPNVHFIGKVPYSEMPSVIKGFDVAIIPFRKSEMSATIFPLKLFEYLGAGKPVVITDFNEDLKEYTADLVEMCNSAEEFSGALQRAIISDNPDFIHRRTELAALHTWHQRAETFGNLLANALSHRKITIDRFM